MEFAQHGDLDQYMRKDRGKAAAFVKEITCQLLGALVVLHEREICHRDLKPQVNLFETSQGAS